MLTRKVDIVLFPRFPLVNNAFASPPHPMSFLLKARTAVAVFERNQLVWKALWKDQEMICPTQPGQRVTESYGSRTSKRFAYERKDLKLSVSHSSISSLCLSQKISIVSS